MANSIDVTYGPECFHHTGLINEPILIALLVQISDDVFDEIDDVVKHAFSLIYVTVDLVLFIQAESVELVINDNLCHPSFL